MQKKGVIFLGGKGGRREGIERIKTMFFYLHMNFLLI
jgi:hypothetical protein